MKRIIQALCAVAGLAAIPAAANAAVINFDDLGDGVEVTNQYADVIFSSTAGSHILTTAQNLGSSLPNFICTAALGSSINCTGSVFVDFANGVSGLTFLAVGDNDSGVTGSVSVFSDGSLLGIVDIITDGNPNATDLVDLSAFIHVTRIEISGITDAAGLGYDDFTFGDPIPGGGVPEPANWAMMIAGFGMVGGVARAARRKVALA